MTTANRTEIAPLAHSTRWAYALLITLLFAGLTVVGSYMEIPLRPVPITMQTLFVLLSGAIAGRLLGPLSQMLYTGFGVAGLPFFAGGAAGLAIFTGPTGGYLIGFMIAPLWVATLLPRSDRFWWQFGVFWTGSLIILTLGVVHLWAFYTDGLGDALRVGYLPFVIGDLLKNAVGVSIYRSYRAIRSRRGAGTRP